MAQTDNFRKYASLFSTTLSASISTGTGETITLASVSGLPTDTEITITIDRVDANGNATPSKMERITGTISGNNLTAYTRGIEGTEQSHSSGAVVEMIWNADDWNDAVDGILTEHNQDGTHSVANMITEGTVKDDPTMADDSATALATQQSIKAMHDTGWTAITETLTYASASTITVAAGAASRYQKGDKLKLTQTTDKYFYIVAVADTLLTVTGGSDYSLANAEITSPMLSRIESPFGFPDWFNYIPIFASGLTKGNGTFPYAKFKISGKQCFLSVSFVLGTTSSITGETVLNLPVNADGTYTNNISELHGNAWILETGTAVYKGVMEYGSSTGVRIRWMEVIGSVIKHTTFGATSPITWTTGDGIGIEIDYRI